MKESRDNGETIKTKHVTQIGKKSKKKKRSNELGKAT